MVTIPIKNMVCRHCMESVLGVFKEMDLEVSAIRLGEVEVSANEKELDFGRLKRLLERNGFELIENRELQIVEKIKTLIVEMIHHNDKLPTVKNSVYLSERLGMSYPHLSQSFSKHEHLTIEKYIILQKIERVKELISYGEQSLSEIAYELGYGSVQHLSNQFRSVTGLSVTQFKKLKIKPRKEINKVGEK